MAHKFSQGCQLTVFGMGTGSGAIDGTMAFDRNDDEMNSRIRFIKIANRVEEIIRLKDQPVSGPPLLLKTQVRQDLKRQPIVHKSEEPGRYVVAEEVL